MKVKDYRQRTEVLHNNLAKGDYFGENALIYECKRTATVATTNYCTFARLTKDQFKELMKELEEPIKQHTLKYRDPLTKFKKKLLRQIDYLNFFDNFENDENYNTDEFPNESVDESEAQR